MELLRGLWVGFAGSQQVFFLTEWMVYLQGWGALGENFRLGLLILQIGLLGGLGGLRLGTSDSGQCATLHFSHYDSLFCSSFLKPRPVLFVLYLAC